MKPSNIGGQAVMEGIMMRHKDKYSIAVRRPDKEIEVKVEDYKCIFGKARIWRKPIIRGMVSFIDSLVTGTKCLMYSAEIAGDEEDEEETRKNAALSPEELKAKKKKEDKAFKSLLYVTVAVSIVISVAAFMLLPYALASLCRKVGASEVVVTIVEAFVKLGLFMGYMILISRMKDIQRTFMYHGAEHKCINCVENGKPLTVENVLESSRFHRRCGTSFLFLVMIVSIFLHFIFVLVPFYWLRLFGRLLMVPVVSGISFEIIQWAGRTDSKFALMMSKPGMAMQKFTTKEPTADMAEVAIKAVEAVFDWRAYLKTEFNLDIPYENKENGDPSAASAQSESGDSEERTGNVPETGKADRYRELIRKRAGHIPLQHITHQAYFMGFEFYVNQNVLVPRQDTETLVEKALEVMKGKKTPGILDMCTGSGCILLSLLALTGDAYGVGADVSPLALQVANKNAVSLEVSDRAVFVESDLFSSAFFQQNTGKDMPQYDILISNPPYIRSAEIEELMEEVRDHDPRLALDGHEDGLYFYRKIVSEGKAFLKEDGWMLFEIGYDQGEAVKALMQENGFFDVQIVKDLTGLDRVVLGRR